jgi:uncharacterized coiled-coil DUF342 family protein
MAKSQKSDFQSKEDLQEYIDGLREVKSQYDSLIAKAKELAGTPGKALTDIKKQIAELQRQTDSYEEIIKSLKRAQSEYDKLNSKQEESTKKTEKQKQLFDDLDDSLVSISNTIGKNTKLYEIFNDRTILTKNIFGDISKELQKGFGGVETEKIEKASFSFAEMQSSILNARKEQEAGNIDMDEYVDKIRNASESFSSIVSKIDLAKVESEELKELITQMAKESNSFGNLAEKMQIKGDFKKAGSEAFSEFFKVTPEIAGAIDGMSDMMKGAMTVAAGKGIYDLIKGGFKVLANAGEIASKLMNAPVVKVRREYELQEKLLETQISQTEQIAKLNAGIVADRANLAFSEQLEQGAAQFRSISKTAFFGSGLGSVKYANDQLQLAGIGANDIVSSMSDMSTGANSGMKGLGTDVAVFAKKTGLATGQVSGLTGMFRMLDKTGGADAFDTLQKSLSGVGLKGFNVADIAGELQNSSELALQYNIKSSAELVKQVKNVRDMGASFSKIAEAGKSMVLNYKDSIRKEMELSAMLGENVDLSEARALFAAGKSDEAFGVLKSSGVLEKAQSQGLFGTQALSAALGGMDLTQLAAGTYEKGPKAGIVSNQQFLDTFTEAMRTLNVENATISAKFALLATGIDTKELKTLYSGDVNAMMVGLQAQQVQNQAMGQIMIGVAEKINMGVQGTKLVAAGAGNVTGMAGYFAGLNTYNMGYMGGGGLSYGGLKPGGIGVNQPFNTPSVNYGTVPTTNTSGVSISTGMTHGIDNSNTGKSIDNQSGTMVRILDRSHKSMIHLEQISTNSSALLKLTQNIQTLTATMSDLPLGFAGMKLLIDGKDVKSRIEKIQTQEKATKK